jgi:hypothetical protein
MDNNYLSHEGVKGQKWGVRKAKTPNLYPRGPFANYRLKRTLKKSAIKMAKVGYKNVDMGGKIDNFKYRWNMRKIMKQYADITYRNMIISRGQIQFRQVLDQNTLEGKYDGNDFYMELGLNRKEDN